MCDEYLLQYYKDNIIEILKDPDENKHFSVNINFVELSGNDTTLGNNFLRNPEESLVEWSKALTKVQRELSTTSDNYTFKKNAHSRIYSLPLYPELHRTKFPNNDDTNKFLQVSGTVVRMTVVKMLEYQRQYICTKCKYITTANADYDMKNIITPPKKCTNPEDCKGSNIINLEELNPESCKDYQEIKIQETVHKLDVGCMPNSMWVTLEDDLVDSCKPGDNITVCGLVKRRQNPFYIGKKMDIELVIKANHIQINNNNTSSLAITPELKDMFQTFWKSHTDRPLIARDIILKSFCPQLFGLYIVKLAMAVVLAGGSNLYSNTNTGIRVRAEPHLLLVGDPGGGKSRLLRFASKIIPRSVLTTGVGSTAAGLTVTAVMENGEWQLEGGALVMADGGICCIDEFNTMKEHDRTSIHEAMEQQTISVAKASIVCKLSTRCSILAATNPKGNIDPSQPLNMNVNLASPLLSRFDLILLLRDKPGDEWDSLLVDYIFNSFENCNQSKLTENLNWTVETLQAYYAVIKKLHPILTEDANRILSAYYQAQRRLNYRNKARTTVRLLDSLVRLSQGHARLMYRDQVVIVDALMAVILIETAFEADCSVFNLRFNLRNDFPQDPTNNYRELVEIVLKKLELADLLKKELDAIDGKKPDDKPGPSCTKNKETIVKRESKFFQLDKKEHGNCAEINGNFGEKRKAPNDLVDENRLQYAKCPTEQTSNIPNVENRLESVKKSKKRTSSESRLKAKKAKHKENEVFDDLDALKCMPSVHDVFKINELELDDVNVEEIGNEISEENHGETMPEGAAETAPIANEKERTETVQKDILSQKTRTKNWFSRFRFVPKETDAPLEELNEPNKTNPFENSSDDIGNLSFANIESSTQKEKSPLKDLNIEEKEKPIKKFNFKKFIPQKTEAVKSPSSSIFEEEDVNDVDLDL